MVFCYQHLSLEDHQMEYPPCSTALFEKTGLHREPIQVLNKVCSENFGVILVELLTDSLSNSFLRLYPEKGANPAVFQLSTPLLLQADVRHYTNSISCLCAEMLLSGDDMFFRMVSASLVTFGSGLTLCIPSKSESGCINSRLMDSPPAGYAVSSIN